MERFATVTQNAQDRILKEKNSKNSLKASKIAMNVLVKYCKEKNIEFNPVTIDAHELDNLLTKFYVEARKENGEFYKKFIKIINNEFFSTCHQMLSNAFIGLIFDRTR